MSRIYPVTGPKSSSAKMARPADLFVRKPAEDTISLPSHLEGDSITNSMHSHTVCATTRSSSPLKGVSILSESKSQGSTPVTHSAIVTMESENLKNLMEAVFCQRNQRVIIDSCDETSLYNAAKESATDCAASPEQNDKPSSSVLPSQAEICCEEINPETQSIGEPFEQPMCRSAVSLHGNASRVSTNRDAISLPGQLDEIQPFSQQSLEHGSLSDVNAFNDNLDQSGSEASCSEVDFSASILDRDEEPLPAVEMANALNLPPLPPVSHSYQLPPVSVMRRWQYRKRGCCSSLLAFLGYSLCALLVYPLLLLMLPLLIVAKLLCCVPCIRCYLGKEMHTIPLFFANKNDGGYSTIAAILKERLDLDSFEDICLSVLDDAYVENRSGIVLKLASKLKSTLGVLNWRVEERATLTQHIVTVTHKITTNRDFSRLIGDLSTKQRNKQLWTVYFVPFFKTSQSAVVIQVHHSIASGSNLKNALLNLLPVNKPAGADLEGALIALKPSAICTFLKIPGLVFKQMRVFPRTRVHGQTRFDFSATLPLKQAYQTALAANCSLDTLFLGCLAHAYQIYYTQDRRKVLRDVVFAIPTTYQSSPSVFNVNLPLPQSRQPLSMLLNKIENQISHNCEDAYILGMAGRVSSLLFPRSITNAFAKSVANSAIGVFAIVDCSSEPIFVGDCIVDSIITWPPLYRKFKLAIIIVCYLDHFRVCVATDQSDKEHARTTILLDHILSAFHDVCCRFLSSSSHQ